MMGFLYTLSLIGIICVSTVIHASLENSTWTPLCQNGNSRLLLSNNNTSIFKIKEGSNLKTFVTNFDPDNIKCVKGFKNFKLERPNAFNSEYTVTCQHSSGSICNATFTVLE